jgi:hypothetical protein
MVVSEGDGRKRAVDVLTLSVRASELVGTRVNALRIDDLQGPDGLKVLRRRGGGKLSLREVHERLLESTGNGLGGWEDGLDTPSVRMKRMQCRAEDAEGRLGELVGLLGLKDSSELMGACKVLKVSASSDWMPGWFCVECGVVNGEAKTERVKCRACDTIHVKTEVVPEDRGLYMDKASVARMIQENQLLRQALARVQGRSSAILEECRRLKKRCEERDEREEREEREGPKP